MNQKDQLSLIDGEFSLEEAKGILMHLYSKKIQFHERRNFSSIEQTGKTDEKSLKRIEELKGSMIQLEAILKSPDSMDCMLKINSVIQIERVPQPTISH